MHMEGRHVGRHVGRLGMRLGGELTTKPTSCPTCRNPLCSTACSFAGPFDCHTCLSVPDTLSVALSDCRPPRVAVRLISKLVSRPRESHDLCEAPLPCEVST